MEEKANLCHTDYSLSPLSLSCTSFQFSSLWFCIWADVAFILHFQMRWSSLCSLVKGSIASGLDYQSLICSSQPVGVCCWWSLMALTSCIYCYSAWFWHPGKAIQDVYLPCFLCFKYLCKACTAITFRLSDKLFVAIFKPFGCVKEIARKEMEG